MAKPRSSKSITRWVRRNQGKHPCGCGCEEYIVVKREHSKPSVGLPKFVKGHNLQKKQGAPLTKEEAIPKESAWDKLSPEERERRVSQLKSFGKGEDNPSWKGGRRLDANGYIQILFNEHPFARDGYMAEHRLVVEIRTRKKSPQHFLLVEVQGEKYLSPKAIVHHIDEVKTNNSSENLMLLPNQAAHAFIHNSPLPMEERLRRISIGVFHSGPLKEEHDA